MQWESGRTRQNLLHSVGESKAKRWTTSDVLSNILSLNILCSANLSYSSLPMPHSGQSSQLGSDTTNLSAQFGPTSCWAALDDAMSPAPFSVLPSCLRPRGIVLGDIHSLEFCPSGNRVRTRAALLCREELGDEIDVSRVRHLIEPFHSV